MGTIFVTLILTIIGAMITQISNDDQIQAQRAMNGEQNDFNAEQAEINRQFNSEPERFNRMVSDLGFNPDLAAASIMGLNGSSGVAASSNLPLIPNTSPIAGLLGGLPDSMLNAMMQPAQMDNLQSITNKNNVEALFVPLTFEAKSELWSSQADKFKAETKFLIPSNSQYYNSLASLYDEQKNYVRPLSEAQVEQYRATAFNAINQGVKAFEESISETNMRGMYDAYTAEALQNVEESEARERFFDNSATSEYYKGLKEFYDANLREKMQGLPWSNDMSFNLFALMASPDDKDNKLGETMMTSLLNGMETMYNKQVENQMDNYWQNLLLQLQGVPSAAAEGLGWGFGMRSGKGLSTGSSDVGKGVKGVNPKGTGFKSQVIEKDGRKYKSWQAADGSVRWSPLESFD